VQDPCENRPPGNAESREPTTSPFTMPSPKFLSAIAPLLALLAAGCAGPAAVVPTRTLEPDPQILQIGDVVRISFPGTPNLDSTQTIRRDGRINLEMVGEVKAIEITPAQLEQELVKLYTPHLVARDVKVTVVSSTFSVFVTGAVMRPGKLQLERAVTAFEAVMEAGGFDPIRANMREVTIIRNEGSVVRQFKVNLKQILDGKQAEPFKLKPFDTVYVPEKFNWF
jgi:polysaccharide export outer membrane protein